MVKTNTIGQILLTVRQDVYGLVSHLSKCAFCMFHKSNKPWVLLAYKLK